LKFLLGTFGIPFGEYRGIANVALLLLIYQTKNSRRSVGNEKVFDYLYKDERDDYCSDNDDIDGDCQYRIT